MTIRPHSRSFGALLAGFLAAVAPSVATADGGEACVAPGVWMVPGTETVLSQPDLLASLAKRDVVLLGEIHIRAEHHRWQLQVVTGLQALRPDLVIGFEMFPRRVQPALDRWVAGELDVAAFLAAGDWVNVWGYDAALYMPLFHFARMHRIPMVALNLDRDVVRSLSRDGWDSVDAVKDLGLSPPATAKTDYVDRLRAIFEEHLSRGTEAADAASREEGFQRFVATQQAWDRVMAQGLAAPRSGAARPLVVGVIGGGHMEYGAGIPNQLRDLGIGDTAVLLAWDAERPCESLVSAEGEPIADAVFGVRSPAPPPRPTRPLLGVLIETADSGVRVSRVVADSVADAAGLKAGDVVVEAAGQRLAVVGDLIAIVQRQAPGTWLPLRVRRDGVEREMVARFTTAP